MCKYGTHFNRCSAALRQRSTTASKLSGFHHYNLAILSNAGEGAEDGHVKELISSRVVKRLTSLSRMHSSAATTSG